MKIEFEMLCRHWRTCQFQNLLKKAPRPIWLLTRSIQRRFASNNRGNKFPIENLRNIGIIAHIDAGKTTTTERMLYYSGYTSRIGDVDDGSTVTDFLPAERARGITIQSAAITFQWPPGDARTVAAKQPLSVTPHEINLIDTPGHADFTFEVLRSLRVLDGAVCILDGVAGVEAQTESVWTQAGVHQIPRLIYINKLDRDGAAFGRTVGEIYQKLKVYPLVCQIPWLTGHDATFTGIGDVVSLRALSWAQEGDGRDISVYELKHLEDIDPKLAEELKKARIALIEHLSEQDDDLVNEFFNHDEDHLAIPHSIILNSLRKVTQLRPQAMVPVLAGASFRNIGVQPLMDSIIDLLPAPLQRPVPKLSIEQTHTTLSALVQNQLPREIKAISGDRNFQTRLSNFQACALAFKVVDDPKRGVLVYIRVYHGTMKKNAWLYNTSLGVNERATRILRMYASDSVDIETVGSGEIGVIIGLKRARTGDTLISYSGLSQKTTPPALFQAIQLKPIDVPPPVFYAAIEPHSLSEERNVKSALETLLREDPSLHVTDDSETGQILLSGMGELHLEIACDRLVKDFKAKATVGTIQIGYREAITTSAKSEVYLDREVAGTKIQAKASVLVHPTSLLEEIEIKDDNMTTLIKNLVDDNVLHIHHARTLNDTEKSEDVQTLPEHLSLETIITAVTAGCNAALAKGPTYRYSLHSTLLHVYLDPQEQFTPETTTGAIGMSIRQALEQAIRTSNETSPSVLLEPVMLATISLREQDMGGVVHDLSSARGASILSLDDNETGKQEADSDSNSNSVSLSQHWNINNIYRPKDPFATHSMMSAQEGLKQRTRQITARVPLKEMVGYLNHLRSLTAGRGTFVMKFDRFEPVRGQRLRQATSITQY